MFRSSWSQALLSSTPPMSQNSARIAATLPPERLMIQVELRGDGGLSFGSSRSEFCRSGSARTRNVSAGTEIVVPGDAVAADMNLVHAAVNHRHFEATKIA